MTLFNTPGCYHVPTPFITPLRTKNIMLTMIIIYHTILPTVGCTIAMNYFILQHVYQWEKHDIIHQPPAPVVEEGKPIPPVVIKSLYRLVSEHKDVVKVVIVLNSIISSFKMDAKQVLSGMAQFEELWNQVC